MNPMHASPPRALITGITGQDGSYLAEMLLAKGWEVHGVVRREALEDPAHRLVNIIGIRDKIRLHAANIDNPLSLYKIVSDVRPNQCYHLAASSFVSYAFDDENTILSHNFSATHYLLSSLKELAPECRLYFAGSSEMFGAPDEFPQNEKSRFNPRSLYGISKLASYHLVANYRRQHGLFACTGILYNHESPRRGFEYVTRKITSAAAKIHLGLSDRLELGNMSARRDWGYAPEYVRAMVAMLERDAPDDYVIATGLLHSVEDVLRMAFAAVGKDYKQFVEVNAQYVRPEADVPLVGDAARAQKILGWKPERSLSSIIEEMVMADIQLLKNSA